MSTMHDKIAKKLHDFVNKILFFEKRKVFKCEGLTLYPSEIHLILIMSEQPTNATQMAEALHVTKGAVSQTITRLEKKGVLRKNKDPYYKNELTLTFTELGQKIFKQMKDMSNKMDKDLHDKLQDFDNSELKTINSFLERLTQDKNTIL